MMTQIRTSLLVGSALAGLLPAGVAHAQVAEADTDSSGIQEIIVTAQKRSESVNTVPLTITAVSGDQLKKQGIENIEDLTKVTPGFQYAQTGINAVYTLRGVGFYDNTLAARGAVAVYLDEVSLPFSVLAPVASFDLERVEVLKGPQGTLFGQNSTGGAINYIAAKPTDSLSAGISGSFGRFARGDVTTFVSGPLSDTVSVRFAGKWEFGGDWQKSYTRSNDDSLGQRSAFTGRAQVAFEPSANFRANLSVTGYINRSDPQAPQYVGTTPLVPAPGLLDPALNPYETPPASNRFADWDSGQDLFQNDDILLASLRMEYDLSDNLTLTSISGYTDYKKEAYRDVDGVAIANDDFATEGNIQVYQQELRINGSVGAIDFIVGANYELDKAYQMDSFIFGPTTSVAQFYVLRNGTAFLGSSDFTRQRYETKSVFANVDVPLGDLFKVRGGIRYSDLDGDGRGCNLATDKLDIVRFATLNTANALRATQGLAPLTIDAFPRGECYTLNDSTGVPMEATPTLNEDNISWRVGIDFQPSNNTLLYALVSRGYKSGSFPHTPGQYVSQFEAAVQESVLAYEAGFKLGMLNRRLQLNGAAFYYDYTNKQLLGRIKTETAFPPAIKNVPKATVKGAELQIEAYPLDDFRISLAGTYLDTRVGEYSDLSATGAPVDFTGSRLPFASKWQATADAEYGAALGSNLRGFIGGSWRYQSATNSGLGDLALTRIDAFNIFDARAGIENEDAGWRVGLYVRNLTKEYYWNNVVRAADTVVKYTGFPRTFGVNFSYKM